MTTVYLVRHCNSVANYTGKLAGWYDVDISDVGKRQLELLSERFKDIKLDKVYSSPLIRAHMTAKAVNKYSDAPLVLDEAFKELYLGELEGRTLSDMTEQQLHDWKYDFVNFRTKEGETAEQVSKRVVEGFKKVVAENEGKTVAIASHGSAMRLLTCYLKGYGIGMYNKIWGLENTAVTTLQIDDEGNATIVSENDRSHLGNNSSLLITTGWAAPSK